MNAINDQPLRVAMVMGKMLGGGVEAVVMNYYRHMDRTKVQFDFLVDADSALVPRSEIEALGGRVFEIPPYQHVSAYQRELVALFRTEGWQIVHSHINALSVFPLRAAKKAGVPVRIAHSHSTSGKGEYAKNAVKALLKTQANRYPTERFACSRAAGEWLFGTKTFFGVMPNALELRKYLFDMQKRKIVRERFGISEDTFVIGHIGRFSRQKNQEFLLKAFYEATETRQDLLLVLVGEGSSRVSCERWCAERGLQEKVLFLGQRDDADCLYCAFDLFALPSLYEGLGIVALEAQICGLPCLVSTNVPKEIDVTRGIEFQPIENERVWADLFIKAKIAESRSVDLGLFTFYDINDAAEILCSKYQALLSVRRAIQ